MHVLYNIVGRDSSVGIATRYGLDGPGIESLWGRDFSHPSRPTLGPTQPPVKWVPGLSQGVKRPGRGADQPPPSKFRGQERVELYLYSPSGPSWPVIGSTFTFTSIQYQRLRCISVQVTTMWVPRRENFTTEDTIFCILYHEQPVPVLNSFCVNCNLKYPRRGKQLEFNAGFDETLINNVSKKYN